MPRPALIALIVPVVPLLVVGILAGAPAAHAAGPELASGAPTVLIDELANGGPRSDADGFIELRNWGATTIDLTGWKLYRCSWQGLRANTGATEGTLDGLVLAPDDRVVVSKAGTPGDTHFTQPYANRGFGGWLEDPQGRVVDRVGVYPNSPWPTQSECTGRSNLANRLDFAAGESWQRIAATGDPARDFVVARSTPGQPNRVSADPRSTAEVVIAEFAAEGAAGDGDDLVELRNDGADPVDLSGWTLDRCTAGGRLRPDTRQLTVGDGTVLAPGATWLAVGPGADERTAGLADARYPVSFADAGSGALVRDARGRLVDRVAMSDYADSACQDGDAKLAAVLDPVAGESYQRTAPTAAAAGRFIVAPRTPGRSNATRESSVFAEPFGYPDAPGVAISELATDPSTEGMPAGSTRRNYIELANYGDRAVDVGGWTLRRCQADGVRAHDLQATVPDGLVLRAGGTWLAALDGTAAAGIADAGYPTALDFLGTGAWLADDDGNRVDSVGVYGRNEMDAPHDVASPCTKGVALTTYQPDRLLAQTFHRIGFTGVDADDFAVAEASPGAFEGTADAVTAAAILPYTEPRTARARAVAASVRAVTAVTAAPDDPLRVIAAFGGATEGGPLATREGDGERVLDAADPGTTADDGWAYPYQRLVVDAAGLPGLDAGTARVSWRGAATGRSELQLSVWNVASGAWRLLDAAGDPQGGGAELELSGRLRADDVADGRASLLVQSGPRTEATLAPGIDGRLQDPGAYDLAISHITDTQYLSESYPQVYEQLTGWIAANADERRIAFATHTGDLVQNWVDPDQPQDRARREFERASRAQAVLDDAGIPNSVLPGNHDSKRGVDYTLYDEYFPPSRYADRPWWGGSIAPDDNTASFSLFERAGAPFLMLSLPYAYGEREIAWAEDVVADHADRNVVISTHEHVSPKTLTDPAHRSTASRWLSRAGQLWDRVIAPNRNVIAVLSGHFHGLGQIVTEDAGGIPGHDVVELLADYQEFRTHTGERATGFQRLLQFDLASNTIAVDTFSTRLAAAASHPYDYRQFLPDNGRTSSMSNDRPWNIVGSGLQGRYTAEDDEFAVHVELQYAKSVTTSGVGGGVAADTTSTARGRMPRDVGRPGLV